MPKEVRSLVSYSDVSIGDDFNSRKKMGDLEGLAFSLDQNGLINPLTVREGGPLRTDPSRRSYFLVAGERRFRAIALLRDANWVPTIDGKKVERKTSPASWHQVEVKLVKGDNQRQSILNLIENLQRENLDPLEEAEAMRRYMDVYKCNQADLAKSVGKSEPYISQRLSLLKKAAPELKKAIESGKVTSTHAREIATLPAEQQKEIIEKIEKKEKETGKKPSTAEVKDETDRRKAAAKRAKNPEYDREKVNAAKEAYDGEKMTVRSLREAQEMLATLIEKLQRAKTPESTKVIKGQIAVAEWFLSLRDALG